MVPAAEATSSIGNTASDDDARPHSVTSDPIPAEPTGERSTTSMSMLTRPTSLVRTPSTSTGVPVGAWRGYPSAYPQATTPMRRGPSA